MIKKTVNTEAYLIDMANLEIEETLGGVTEYEETDSHTLTQQVLEAPLTRQLDELLQTVIHDAYKELKR
jgi:hypothetical protein